MAAFVSDHLMGRIFPDPSTVAGSLIDSDAATSPDACPFCGGTRIAVDRVERAGYDNYPNDSDRWGYYAVCSSCAAQGPWNKTSRESAIRQWNRRPLRERDVQP